MSERTGRLYRGFEHKTTIDIDDLVERFEKSPETREPLTIAVLGNVTIDQLSAYLRYRGYLSGFDVRVYSEYSPGIMSSVNDPGGRLYSSHPDFILLVAHLNVLSPLLWNDFSSSDPAEIVREANRTAEFMRNVVDEIRRNSSATVVVNSFEVPVFPAGGIADFQQPGGQVETIRALNMKISEMVRGFSSAYVLDLELLTARAGYSRFVDARYWQIARIPYTPLGWDMLGEEYLKYVRAFKGRAKKCLVLDCDNTLWGGVVGELGFDGIALDPTYPGSPYLDFQKAVRELHHRGVVLALCSKNNERDVLEVLEKHPHMALRRSDFASVRINWEDKATNIKALSAELQLGLDAFVFIDDSSFEIELVRRSCPGVTCMQLPKDQSEFRELILSCGLFDTPSLTREDARRTDFYTQEAARREARHSVAADDLSRYLLSLEQRADLDLANEFAIPRIAQLTQKTNQFNLTTRRYSEAQIRDFVARPDREVLYLNLRDNIGDSGIVGVCILAFSQHRASIDTFLLSCRVIGRGAETVLLKAALERCTRRPQVLEITGNFLPSAKNDQVRDFYPRHGFASRGVAGDAFEFVLDRAKAKLVKFPDYYKSIILCGNQEPT